MEQTSKLPWWHLGTVCIPEEKKEELNGYVMQLFDLCGIRKTMEVGLDGRTFTVVRKVRPDEQGICTFDYSIFEKRMREKCTYDTNTCQLEMNDHGGNEFGIFLNLLMLLLESYSDTTCCLMYKDRPEENSEVYMKLLEKLLGRKFYLNSRGRFFDEMLLFQKNGVCKDFTMIDYLNMLPRGFAYMEWEQLFALYCVISDKPEPWEVDQEITAREEIAAARDNEKWIFMHKIMTRLYEEDEKCLTAYLRKLLASDAEERKRMCQAEGDFGTLAELSLYLLPAVFVKTYALLEKTDFLTEWEKFGDKGYNDVLKDMNKEKERKKEQPIDTDIPFFKVILRKDEDEFLEFWQGDNLALSNKMREEIGRWKEDLETAEDIPEDAVERYLADVVSDLAEDHECRYVDADFVKAILKNRGEANYRKALVLLRGIMEKDVRYFPELTRKQAMEWVVKKNRSRHDRVIMMAFHSLLINPRMRDKILGF